jgi:hypothetical protein
MARSRIVKLWYKPIAEALTGVKVISMLVDKGDEVANTAYDGSVFGILFWD